LSRNSNFTTYRIHYPTNCNQWRNSRNIEKNSKEHF